MGYLISHFASSCLKHVKDYFASQLSIPRSFWVIPHLNYIITDRRTDKGDFGIYIAYMLSHSLNMNARISSGTRSQTIGIYFNLLLYFVTNHDYPGDTARMLEILHMIQPLSTKMSLTYDYTDSIHIQLHWKLQHTVDAFRNNMLSENNKITCN